MHLKDDDLILRYYGELDGAPESRATEHLAECTSCRAAYSRLQQVLTAVDDCPTPDLPDGFERVVWARLQPDLGRPQRGWLSRFVLSPAHIALVAAVVLLVTGAFFAGRMSNRAPAGRVPELAASQLRERVLLADLGDHLDRSQAMLIELVSGDGAAGISAERERAEQLVSDNRLYRQTAERTGNVALVTVLDELEQVLVDVAAGPDVVSATDIEQLRRQIETNGLLFKVRVLSSEVRDRQKTAIQRRTVLSS
jgi:anti-sigma factor RsiW